MQHAFLTFFQRFLQGSVVKSLPKVVKAIRIDVRYTVHVRIVRTF